MLHQPLERTSQDPNEERLLIALQLVNWDSDGPFFKESTIAQADRELVVRQIDEYLKTRRAFVRLRADQLGAAGIQLEVKANADGVPSIHFIYGSPALFVTLPLAFALATKGDRVRRCPDPKCQRLFLRTGKMEFCSVACSRRVYMRTYRKRVYRGARPKGGRRR